jgi:hypothetical protein
MDRAEYDAVKDEIAQALVASGCGYGSPVVERFAEVVRDVVLTQGEYGICLSAGCRNEASNEIGFPLCRYCSEAVDLGAMVATANSDLAQYDLRLDNHWLERLEEKIRRNLAREFQLRAGEPGRSEVVKMAYRDAADIASAPRTVSP